jgi:ribosomal protein S18 acetylase RimI-like enzyme
MQAEIGFTLAKAYQGHGYATEAVGQVLEHLFTWRNLRRISAECDARNVPSARLLRRLGFVEEGCRRAHTWVKGEWTDDLLFGLLATNWRSLMRRTATSESPCDVRAQLRWLMIGLGLVGREVVARDLPGGPAHES